MDYSNALLLHIVTAVYYSAFQMSVVVQFQVK